MKEAYFYTKLEDGRVECLLCPHVCKLNNEQYGICNSRKNINGTLIATSYGNICAIGIDPIEKKPLMHFLPSTKTYSISSAGCNFRCLHCQNDGISQYSPEQRTSFEMTPEQVVQAAIDNGCRSISYTYTEPTTFYEFMIDTAKLANSKGLKNICVSNGYINEDPLIELCKYVNAFNIDLKYFDDNIYKKVSKGTLDPILKTLEIIKENMCWLEITNLIIPDINDNEHLIKQMCKWLAENGFGNYPLHFSRFYPKYKMMEKSWTTMGTMFEAYGIAKEEGIKYVYLGNVPNDYVGDVICPHCEKKVIGRYGYELINNNIGLMGRCNYCGKQVDGIF